MKLLHLADLHLGKRVFEYPMLEDQRVILSEILDIVRDERIDAVLIAGDVYDRPVPPQEATALLSDFLCALAAMHVRVLMISGNHDSAERLAFCAELLAEQGVHVCGSCEGKAVSVALGGGDVPVAVHMLSYARPVTLRPYLGEGASSAEAAMRSMIAGIELCKDGYNILLAHTFVQGGESSDSEQVVVGTVDNVPASVFAPFDYVALGHLHRPQSIGDKVRYAGSPLCYSFSEIHTQKSVTILELGEEINIRTLPLHPIHPMREVRGGLAELLQMDYSEDYVRAVVTDEEVAPDARVTLRTVFPNLMRFAIENSRTRYEEDVPESENVSERAPLDLFAEFYEHQNGVAPDEARLRVMRALLEEVEQL